MSPWSEGGCQGLNTGAHGHGHVGDDLVWIQWSF